MSSARKNGITNPAVLAQEPFPLLRDGSAPAAPCKCPWAAGLAPVDLQVLGQVVTAGKLLLTGWALVGLDPGVGALVAGELVRAGEPAGEREGGGLGTQPWLPGWPGDTGTWGRLAQAHICPCAMASHLCLPQAGICPCHDITSVPATASGVTPHLPGSTLHLIITLHVIITPHPPGSPHSS